MSEFHTPVLIEEAFNFLSVKPGSLYIDCNIGGGGHTAEIIKRGGRVLGIDWDKDAIEEIHRRFPGEIKNGQLIVAKENFVNIKEVVLKKGIKDVAGVLFDLGVSSHQFNQSERGFSFQTDAPLDMRMDRTLQVKALDLINGLNEGELSELFWRLGEERASRAIARKIVEERVKERIETTQHLAEVVRSVIHKAGKINPATRVFQALRIAVNDELNNLRLALPDAVEIMSSRGRLVVICFHSLEDRIVKNFFNDYLNRGLINVLTDKPVIPSEEEIALNPRSRSAKLRAAEKI